MSQVTAGRMGRRPKAGGQREALITRLPSPDAEHYRQKAEACGLSVSSWMALQLAQATGRPVPDFVVEEMKKAAAERGPQHPALFNVAQAS